MIHKTAIVDKNAKISKNVEIGPYCIIGPEVEIGNNSVTIITGPESGFSEKELVELTSMQEIKMRYLGENVLRAETAPIVVSSVIKNHFGRI